MYKSYVKFLSAMLIFGSIGIFVTNIPLAANMIILARTVIGGAILTALLFLSKKNVDTTMLKKNAVILLLSGLALGLNWLFLFESYRETSVSIATILYYMAPIIVTAASPIILKEHLTLSRMVSIIIAIWGLTLITGIGGDLQITTTGLFFGIASAIFYAALMLLNKKINGLDSLTITIVQLWIAALIMLLYVLIRHQPPIHAMTITAMICLLFVGIVHTGFACYLYFSSIQELEAQSIAMLSYLDPVSALLFSAVFLHERLSITQWVGALLILGASIISELIKVKKNKTEYA